MNQLYFGDCLDVLKKLHAQHPQGFIDLVYIDPPFNSKRNYNILFESIDIHDTKAQKEAFSDTWSNVSYHDTLHEIQDIDLNLFGFLQALDNINVSKSAISYLATMSLRIWYIHKVLKNTGSFYLHCDSTMSHYLKIACDLIFGISNYHNEIIWKRTNSLKTSQFKDRKYGIMTDSIFYYSKSTKYFFDSDKIKVIFSTDDIEKRYQYEDEKGRYTKSPLFRGMTQGERPNLCYEYKGFESPNKAGWKISKDRLIELDNQGDIGWSNSGIPFRKYRPEHTKGFLVSNLWDDINITGGKERLHYPTQKPIELLERILTASSNEGDLVADFFCGCGTTIAAAEKLNRKWLGVDISHLAIQLIRKRLTDPYPEEKRKEILKTIEISGFPKDIASARELAEHTDKHRIKFQDWVVEVLIGGVSNPAKSGDGGVDGHLTFYKSADGKQRGLGIIEVKSGNVSIAMVRSFMSSIDARKADLGIFVCFAENVTDGMRREVKAKGFIEGYKIDKVQILTIEELMDGICPRIPSPMSHFGSSTKRLDTKAEDEGMF